MRGNYILRNLDRKAIKLAGRGIATAKLVFFLERKQKSYI
jgi:hypothetical protein